MSIGIWNSMDHYTFQYPLPVPASRCLSCPLCDHELDRRMLEYFKTSVVPYLDLDEDDQANSRAPVSKVAIHGHALQRTTYRNRTAVSSQTRGNSKELVRIFGGRVRRCERKCARIMSMLSVLSNKPLQSPSSTERFLRSLLVELKIQSDIVRLDNFNLFTFGPSKLCRLFSSKITLLLYRCHETKKQLAAIENRRADVRHTENM